MLYLKHGVDLLLKLLHEWLHEPVVRGNDVCPEDAAHPGGAVDELSPGQYSLSHKIRGNNHSPSSDYTPPPTARTPSSYAHAHPQ